MDDEVSRNDDSRRGVQEMEGSDPGDQQTITISPWHVL